MFPSHINTPSLSVFLRAAKLRIECCQEAAAHSDIVAAAVTDELRTVREELDNLTALCKR